MAHFAELDENNIVIRVVVVADKDCLDENGQESDEAGDKFLHSILGGRWIRTSYNGNIRGCFAGPGLVYDPVLDIFVAP